MSQENVEIVRAIYEGAEAMNMEQLLAALPELIRQMCDPEIEWMEDPRRPDSRTYRGHDGVLASFERWLEGFDEYGISWKGPWTVATASLSRVERRALAQSAAQPWTWRPIR
jgi:hypothetical protein